MRREWTLFLTAVQFLTRCPVPAWVGHSPAQLNAAVRYFPLVGAAVGILGAALFALARTGLPPLPSALLSMAATLVATGAFHEDGLADMCDGLYGGWTRDDVLRIMKDSRIGSFGAAGLFMILALKASATLTPGAIVAAHALSRLCAVILIAALPYVRESEQGAKAKPVADGVGAAELGIAGLCGLLPLLLIGWAAPAAVLVAGLLTAGMGRWFRRRLGGYTGDCLGGMQQVAEVAVLLVALWHAA